MAEKSNENLAPFTDEIKSKNRKDNNEPSLVKFSSSSVNVKGNSNLFKGL